MPDIRSFFAPKGGAPATTSQKPSVKKSEEPQKGRRTKRKVIEDSDEEESSEERKKPLAKSAKSAKAKPQHGSNEIKGTATTANEYFGSADGSQVGKSQTPKKKTIKEEVKVEVPVRSSPRNKPSTNATSAPKDTTPVKNGISQKRKATTSYAHSKINDDEDAFMDDGDDDDDGFEAADMKATSRHKRDEYKESESEEEILPQPKRKAGRTPTQSASKAGKATNLDKKVPVTNKKRKSPEESSSESSEDLPRKKTAPAKPRAPRALKAPEPENAEIKDILDSVTTVRAPTPPPRDPNTKFDWKKGGAGGGNAAAQPQGSADIPEGEEECLSGLNFVFTGVMRTIGRDEAQVLVKRYGGKVTGQPSSKTSFVVLGDDAGPSKLEKIKANGIKTIDENGLFELIRKLPAYGGAGNGAQKAQEKKKVEEEKVKKQVAEMEAEEKKRRVEEAAANKKAAIARGDTSSSAVTLQKPTAQLLTTKYAPTQLSHICGNKAQVEKIQSWLKNWAKSKKYNFQRRGADGMGGARAIIVSGPPGIGKTTAAHLAARMEGYDVLESNASDSRSKKLVENGISDVLNNTSLNGYFAGDGKTVDQSKKKLVLIMDEVDGMSAGDRGGVGALAKFCKKTEVPLILICNERRLPKMKPFDHVTFDIRFARPTVDQVRSRIMTICHREGLRLPPPVIDALIEGSNKDIRQIINMISTAKLDQTSMDFNQSKSMSKAWEKHVVLKPWDICHKMLSGGLFAPTSKATLNDKIELYFNDHEFSFLMIQENYLRTKPMALNNQGYTKREEKLKTLELFDDAAQSISDGDLVDRMIHGPQQQWSLMPTHAIFSTVRPASLVAGQLMGTNFTAWLGNLSKTGKMNRFVREIHSHMRLRSSGDHNEIRQEYLPVLWNRLVNRLQNEGNDAVEEVIGLMDSYYLTREDFDAVQELGVGFMTEENVSIESKTKAAFTRTYNSMSHPVPFMKASSVVAPKKQTKDAPDLEEAIEEDDDAEVVEPIEVDDENEIDFKKDKYIKQPKAKKVAKKTAKPTAGADDDADESKDQAKPKARGKAKGTGAKPKAKK